MGGGGRAVRGAGEQVVKESRGDGERERDCVCMCWSERASERVSEERGTEAASVEQVAGWEDVGGS